MIELILGAVVCASATVGLFFVRFWRQTRDRLFLFFALAFLILGAQWATQAVLSPPVEAQPYLYLPRLLAFALIIAGVVDKNRS